MTKLRPFNFDEFRSGAPEAAEPKLLRTFLAEDVDKARAEGVIEGRRLAMETIAADDRAALQAIAAHISDFESTLDAEKARIRRDICAAASLFLQEFCAELSAAREIEIAQDLLHRLTENSEDRRAAKLAVCAKSFGRLADRLHRQFNESGIGDFVSLTADNSLKPGEASLEWRGGGACRSRAEINAAVAAIIEPIAIETTERRS